MTEQEAVAVRGRWRLRHRLVSAFGLALVIALTAFMLFSASRAGTIWFASLWFLALLPAMLCALICYIATRTGTESPASIGWSP